MPQVQFIQVTPEENRKPVLDYIDKKFNELKKHLQPKEPTIYLTRQETSKFLKVDLSTIHNWTKQNKLVAYSIGARVYYKRKEIENAIVKLEK